MSGPKTGYRVGVAELDGKLLAYTRYITPTCCIHYVSFVEAVNGAQAKRIAMRMHREECMEPATPSAAREE